MKNEKWVEIEGFNDYEISNLGRVKSHKNGKTKILQTIKKRRFCKDQHYVKLCKNGIRYGFIIDRLLYFCFGIGTVEYPTIHPSEIQLKTKRAKAYIRKVLNDS